MRDSINIGKVKSYSDEDNVQIHLEEKNSYSRPRGSNIYLGSHAGVENEGFCLIRNPDELTNSMRAKYIFDFYLQIDIACINGNFLQPDDFCPYQIDTQDMNVIKPEFEKEIE